MPTRVYLNWNQPALPLLVDRLLPDSVEGALRFDDTLIIVPTRNAGRRLREALAKEVVQRGGTALLSLQVAPPTALFQHPTLEPATPLEVLGTWQVILTGKTKSDLPVLLPQQTESFSSSSALSLGRRLQQLRNELVDANLDLRSVAAGKAAETPDAARWQDLARLEDEYLEALSAAGLHDPCALKREAITLYQPPAGTKRIILAVAPDPSPLALECLRRLDTELEIECWIHAPESEAAGFDAWGRPDPSWAARHLTHWPETGTGLLQTANPQHACALAGQLLRQHAAPDAALGLLDASMAPTFAQAMQAAGVNVFQPAPQPLREQSSLRLIRLLVDLSRNDNGRDLRRLLRLPDYLQYLADQIGKSPVEILRCWDALANRSLPATCAAAVDLSDPSSIIHPALQELQKQLTRLRGDTPVQSLRDLLADIYNRQTCTMSAGAEQRQQFATFKKLADEIQEAARREAKGENIDLDLLLLSVSDLSVDPVRADERLDAEGWLELPYHPAPSLVLLGLHEGIVPTGRTADAFLPDGFRKVLGLRCDDDLHPRDAYILQSLLACRSPTQVQILCCKTDASGSPLHPSRLLFQVEDQELLVRLRELFRDIDPPHDRPVREPGFMLRMFDNEHLRPEPKTLDRLFVTAFRDYLACPTRFYLQRALGTDSVTDRKREPDNMDFGNWIHQVLEHLASLPDWHAGDAGKLQGQAELELDQLLRRKYGPSPALAIRIAQTSALHRLQSACVKQAELASQGWETIATELKLKRVVGDITVVGTIDRIDLHPEHGLRLIDYKSTDSGTESAQAHWAAAQEDTPDQLRITAGRGEKRWVDLQLPLYRWLLQEHELAAKHATLRTGYFRLPKALSNTGVEIWEAEAQHVNEAESAIHWVIDQVRQGVFTPPATKLTYDDFEHLAEGFPNA